MITRDATPWCEYMEKPLTTMSWHLDLCVCVCGVCVDSFVIPHTPAITQHMLLCSRWMRGVFCPSYPNLVRAGCERWCARAKWTYVWHDVDGKIKRGWGWLRKIRGTNWLCQVVNSCECLFFLLVYCKTKKSNVILMTYNNKYNVLFSFLSAFNRNTNRCSPPPSPTHPLVTRTPNFF